MRADETNIKGAFIITNNIFEDKRGFFMESFNKKVFDNNIGLFNFVQDNHSKSSKGVLRGLHYQIEHPQGKLVRCTQGSIYDVIVDIRPNSNTFGQWTSTILSSEKMNAVYIPKGFAHGYQTLCNNCQMLYLHTEVYNPNSESGFRHTSPYLDIKWPLKTTNISIKDSELKNFSGKKNDL